MGFKIGVAVIRLHITDGGMVKGVAKQTFAGKAGAPKQTLGTSPKAPCWAALGVHPELEMVAEVIFLLLGVGNQDKEPI